MNNNVKLKIIATHNRGGDKETIEQLVDANYIKRGESNFLLYEEISDEGQTTSVRIKYSQDELEVNRKGAVSSTLRFIKDKLFCCEYATATGILLIDTDTRVIDITDNRIYLNYRLLLDGEVLSESSMEIFLT